MFHSRQHQEEVLHMSRLTKAAAKEPYITRGASTGYHATDPADDWVAGTSHTYVEVPGAEMP